MSVFIDAVSERNRAQTLWINCSDVFFRQHRFKLFGFFFLQSVVAKYPGQTIHLHCDDSHLALTAREAVGVSVHHYGTVHPVSRALTRRLPAAVLAVKTWLRDAIVLIGTYRRERKIPDQRMDDESRTTLLVTTDRSAPWCGGDPGQHDRIWGTLGDEIKADYGVLMVGSPGADPRAIHKRATAIELLNSLPKLLGALLFRTNCLRVFFGFLFGSRCPQAYRSHLGFYTAPLFDDLMRQAPKWYACHVALAEFLQRHQQYHTLLYFGEFGGFGRAILLAARNNRRAALAYAHGFYYEAHLQLRFTARELGVFAQPDAYIVWSRQTLGIMKRNAKKLLPVCIAGQSRLHPPAELPASRSKRGRIGILPSTADSPSLMEYLESYASYFQRHRFMWKPHPTRPKTDDQSGQLSLERFSGNGLDRFYDGIDCLIVGCSTAGAEALLRGIPVIVALEPVKWGANAVTVHAPDRGVYLAGTPEELQKACDLYTNAPSPPLEWMQEEAKRYLGSFSADRVVRLIQYHERNSLRK
ncbi:MAG: hypothetical protein ABIK45_04390 [Pseudomonadota bacterium]